MNAVHAACYSFVASGERSKRMGRIRAEGIPTGINLLILLEFHMGCLKQEPKHDPMFPRKECHTNKKLRYSSNKIIDPEQVKEW